MPTAGVQVVTFEGIVGSGWPLAILGTQVPLPPGGALHQSALEHMASVMQPAAHMPMGLQIGVVPEHCVESVHWTQVLVVMLQYGVGAEHCESMVQASQLPWLGPVVAQIVDRHTTSPSVPVQGPSPLA
jgi:tagatose-1,6-bisphosphate aldolase non-catalytic subunit AgaZ/GatZ